MAISEQLPLQNTVPKKTGHQHQLLQGLSHKDDVVAYGAAQKLCKLLKKPVCAIAGIHLDSITEEEIAQITRNCERLVDRLFSIVGSQSLVADEPGD
jgi:hypothetical protein